MVLMGEDRKIHLLNVVRELGQVLTDYLVLHDILLLWTCLGMKKIITASSDHYHKGIVAQLSRSVDRQCCSLHWITSQIHGYHDPSIPGYGTYPHSFMLLSQCGEWPWVDLSHKSDCGQR